MIFIDLPAVISINKCGLVFIIHHKVKVAVIIKVAISCTVGKAGLFKPPGNCHIFKTKVFLVMIGFVQ